jgi:D-xylonolactonase
VSTEPALPRETFAQIELIADYACEIGENPLWHPIERRLYWTDIAQGRLFRFDPASGIHEQCYHGRPVGGFTIQANGALLLFMDRGTIAIWREGDLLEIIPEIPAESSARFNDVIADPQGRVFCGTLSDNNREGRLYRLDPDGSLHCLVEGLGCSNGMAFTGDQKTFYHTDSLAHEIYSYFYNVETGSIENRRVFARFEDSDGLPDGITLDLDGCLWVALWGGSCIARLSQDGRVAKRLLLPTKNVSSLTFGGDEYGDLYITTAGGNQKAENGESAGALFRLKGQSSGLPEFFSRIRLAEK